MRLLCIITKVCDIIKKIGILLNFLIPMKVILSLGLFFEKIKIKMDYKLISDNIEISDLVGKNVRSIYSELESVIIETECGCKYIMSHHQECCEDVWLEDVDGTFDFVEPF